MQTRNGKWKKAAVVGGALAGVLVLAGFGPARASRPWRGGPERMEKMANMRLELFMDEIDATDAQRERIKALAAETFKDMGAVHADNKGAREQLMAQWEREDPDKRQVHGIIDERMDALRGAAHRVADRVLELHATLTPEQRAEVAAQVREHGSGH